MKLIFYKDAANILDTTPDSIAHGVKRGALTKAGHKGRNSLLIEEQVLLFKGRRNGRKKWLSLHDLTPPEVREWKRYALEASQATMPASLQQEEIKAMIQAEFSQQEEQFRESFGNFLLQMGLQFKETIRPQLKEIGRQKREVPEGVPFLMSR